MTLPNRVLLIILAMMLLAVACQPPGPSVVAPVGPPPTPKPRPELNATPGNLAPTRSEPARVLLRGATLLTGVGPAIEGGDLLLEDGRIVAISETPLDPPEGVEVIDVTGRFVTPGLIDTHSHLGVYPTPYVKAHSDGNEATSPTTPGVQSAHGVWPQDPGFFRALRGGVTTLQILPGSANLIGGRAITLQLHPGISTEAMRFPGAPGGLKMACGENPKRVYGERRSMPSTRMGNMAVFRKTFMQAAAARDAWREHEEAVEEWLEAEPSPAEPAKEPSQPGRDLDLEALQGVLSGEILVHVHCYRADEMIQVLQLAAEFGFHVRSFHHAVEAYKIRDVLAAWDVSVSTWADWWGFKIEAHDAIPENAGLVSQAGARAIIHSDSSEGIQRLNQEAAKAYQAALAAGLPVSEEEALRWITLNPAWALGVDGVTGSLEVDKRADVVVWSTHPFSVYARTEHVFVEGVHELDHRDPTPPWSDFILGHRAAQEAP